MIPGNDRFAIFNKVRDIPIQLPKLYVVGAIPIARSIISSKAGI